MGSGKSHIARQLSDYFMLPLVDLDQQIEKQAGMSIAHIFDTHGEPAFRQMEHDMLRSICSSSPCIVATGGGAPCFLGNMEWMLSHGVVVWLNPPVQVLVDRLRHQKAQRPLVANLASDAALAAELERLLQLRKPWYSRAQVVLDTMPVDGDKAITAIEAFLAQSAKAL